MKKVLVVEDQREIRELITLTLDDCNVEVHEAENGDAGLALALKIKPDLMLLDVMMPGTLDGFAVCKNIKANASMKATKVILLTAQSRDDDLQKGKSIGVDAYLTKPFSPRGLLDVVNRFIGRLSGSKTLLHSVPSR